MECRILPAGDSALIVEFDNRINEESNRKVQSLANVLKQKKIKGIQEVVPTFRSLMITYDSSMIDYFKLKSKIQKISFLTEDEKTTNKRVLLVPCCYGGAFGPDLQGMEKILNISSKEIIDTHAGKDYRIYMLGFLPGFVYLGGMDKKIVTPRLETPRTAIPARSVGIGGCQTGVYPVESPGGWRLIGKTPLEFYDPHRKPEILCHAGEYIRFIPIDQKEYQLIRQDVENGVYCPEFITN